MMLRSASSAGRAFRKVMTDLAGFDAPPIPLVVLYFHSGFQEVQYGYSMSVKMINT